MISSTSSNSKIEKENSFDPDEFTKIINKIFLKESQDSQTKESFSKENNDLLKPLKFPPLIQIGISTKCNLQCPQCYHPVYSKKNGYKVEFMDFNIYKKIIDEIEEFPPETILRFLGRGESLMHPQVIKMLRYARLKLKSPIALITNGHLLSASKAISLFRTKIDVIDISIDAVSPETYKKVRSGDYFNLIKKIDRFIGLREKGKFPTKIMVSFLIQPENYFEAEDFKKIWTKKVDKVIFRKYHTYGGKIKEKFCVPEPRHPCAALWNRININESGKITLCYIDWNESTVLSDLNEDGVSIIDTWRKKYARFRAQHISAKYPALCKNCKTGWQAAHWGLSYEKAIEMVINKRDKNRLT